MKLNKIKTTLMITILLLSNIAILASVSATGNSVTTYYPTLVETTKSDADWVTWTVEDIDLNMAADTGATAEWSTAQATVGTDSVHLAGPAPDGTGKSARIVLPMPPGTTLDDIDTVSWMKYSVDGYTPHLDIYLDVDGSSEVLVAENHYNNPWWAFEVGGGKGPTLYEDGGHIDDSYGAWFSTFESDDASDDTYDDVNDATLLWIGRLGGGPGDAPSGTLAAWKSGVVTTDPGSEMTTPTIDGDTPVVKLEIEVDNWVSTPDVYIDGITINGEAYLLEEHDGALYGAKLSIDADAAFGDYAYVRTYPNLVTDVTIGTLAIDEITFDYYLVDGSTDHPDLELRFESTVGTGAVDVTIFPTWNKVTGIWDTADGLVDTIFGVAYGANDAGTAITIETGSNPLSAILTALSDYDAWELTRITPQIGWGQSDIVAYIDNVKVDGVEVEYFEPSSGLDYADYKLDDALTLTVFDIGLNTRPTVSDVGEYIAASDYPDQITVDLAETGPYTSVFAGTFTAVDSSPGAADLLCIDETVVSTSYITATSPILTATVTIDGQAPAVTNPLPIRNANITDTSPLIKAMVTDTSAIEAAWMMLDGGLVDAAISDDYLEYQVPALPIEVTLTEGVHTVLVYSIDAAGNINQTTWDFNVDSTNPVGVVTHNDTGYMKGADAVKFSYEFGETMDSNIAPTLSGNATTKMVLDGSGYLDVDTFIANYTITAGFNGTVFLEMTGAKDMAGNEMYSANMSLYIDSLNPTAPSSLASSAAATAVTITWDASEDVGTGMASYNIYKDGDGTPIGSVATGTLTYTDSGLSASATLSYIVEAVDVAGNKVNSSAKSVVFELGEVTEWEISLNEGWNLVSLPLIPDDSSIAVVLAGVLDDIDIVWSYDEATSVWASYAPETPSGLSEMEDGDGYWIKSLDNVTLTISGTEMPEPPLMPPTYDLVAGWNLIGYKALTAMHADDYLGATVAADTIRIYGFADGAYFGVPIGSDLVPGLGYWIAMADVGTIYP